MLTFSSSGIISLLRTMRYLKDYSLSISNINPVTKAHRPFQETMLDKKYDTFYALSYSDWL
jgi:hypothetical protein